LIEQGGDMNESNESDSVLIDNPDKVVKVVVYFANGETVEYNFDTGEFTGIVRKE
jgi:hypothetical protein